MSENIKYDNPVNIKEHLDLIKKALKPSETHRIRSITATTLYDNSIHYEIVVDGGLRGTKTFATYITSEVYNKDIKPLHSKLKQWTEPNKRHPDKPHYQFPVIVEDVLDQTTDEDLYSFFDDFVDKQN